MPLVRVYQNPDGSVRILHPNPAARTADDDDATWLARMAAQAVAADPTLVGLPVVDLPDTAIPSERVRPNPTGAKPLDVRRAWRLQGRKVVVRASEIRERG